MVDKPTMGLWRKRGIAGGKYLVLRRDGTVPEWPSFVLGARDPGAPHALRTYQKYMLEQEHVALDYYNDLSELADEFAQFRLDHGAGDPDRGPHRKDDPNVLALMAGGKTLTDLIQAADDIATHESAVAMCPSCRYDGQPTREVNGCWEHADEVAVCRASAIWTRHAARREARAK